MPLRVNVEDMSDMEIADHIKAFQKEQERRRAAAEDYLWNALCKTLKQYVKEFGSIDISFDGDWGSRTTTLLPDRFDTTTHGVIEIL